ncbi:MAG TPA: hypothetical protein ENL20_03125 [Candidatus Cloacimonetes bacterium]|nr:hypothetical protein [Candidatus Cloacimonadota bacterium]
MLKRTLIILFIISMVFNIAFVSTFIYHRIMMRPRFPEQPIPEPLSPYPELIERIEEGKKQIMPLRQKFQKSKTAFIEALKSQDFNKEELMLILEKTLENQVKMEKELGLRLIELRKEMNPEQARRFFCRRQFQQPEKQQPKFPKFRELIKNRRKEK